MAFLGSEQVLLELLLSWADWFAQKSGGWQSSRNKVAFRYTILARKGDNTRESPLDRQKIAWASGGPFKNVTLTLASTEFMRNLSSSDCCVGTENLSVKETPVKSVKPIFVLLYKIYGPLL